MHKIKLSKSKLNFLDFFEKQMKTPIVILNEKEEIIWKNNSFDDLITLENKSWDMTLKENFTHTHKDSFFPRMLQSQKRPGQIFDVRSQIVDKYRMIELTCISNYQKQLKKREESHSSQTDISLIFDDLLEDLNHEIVKRGILFRVIPEDCLLPINDKILTKAFGHTLKAMLKVFENTSITISYKKINNQHVSVRLTNKYYTTEDLATFKKSIQEKATIHLQMIEETLRDYTPNIKIYEAKSEQTEPSFNVEVIFSPHRKEQNYIDTKEPQYSV